MTENKKETPKIIAWSLTLERFEDSAVVDRLERQKRIKVYKRHLASMVEQLEPHITELGGEIVSTTWIVPSIEVCGIADEKVLRDIPGVVDVRPIRNVNPQLEELLDNPRG